MLRAAIEQATPYKCCVVYGSLPSETRAQQARLFNGEDTGYDVLVATDAIGMGLNLNIRRVVFHATTKSDGVRRRRIEPTQLKQIAGRAAGAVTTLRDDLERHLIVLAAHPRLRAGRVARQDEIRSLERPSHDAAVSRREHASAADVVERRERPARHPERGVEVDRRRRRRVEYHTPRVEIVRARRLDEAVAQPHALGRELVERVDNVKGAGSL